ncbi:MAG: helicase-related protein [Chloroflexi bacterium]|nr:helicase-related protein [Chloroflexota bacterium]
MSGNQSSSSVRVLGLSATPGRVDPDETEDLVALFQGRLLSSRLLGPNPVETLQRRGVLARLKFRRFTNSNIPADDEGWRTLVAARACVELRRRQRKPLVFAASVPGAIVLAQALRGRGLRAEALHAETPSTRRRAVVSDFANGKVEVLVNHRLLATGYDCPAVSDVLILGPVGSPIQFEQIVGRAARGPMTGGSRAATVWDFDNHLKVHGLPNSYYRYRDYDWQSLMDSDT